MGSRGFVACGIVLLMILISIPGCIGAPGEFAGLSFLPIVRTFDASPAIIKSGEYSTLSWTVAGASKVSIDNGIGNVALMGSIAVSPGTTTYYTLTATNSSGNTTARTLVVVSGSAIPQQEANPPAILYYFADKNNINPGEGVTVYWSVSGATQIILEPGGIIGAQGNQTVYPSVTTVYTLTASNPNGIIRNTLAVSVISQGGSQVWTEKSVVLPAIPGESGSLVKNNAVYTVQDTACAGDTSLNLASRAFLSFDISGIPRNAIIDEAILDFGNSTILGAPSYTGVPLVRGTSMVSGMGALEVYFYQYGGLSDLNIMAYNRPAVLVNGGSMTNYPLLPWGLDVSNSYTGERLIQNLVDSGQTRCQFRIQFFTSTNWDMKADMVCFDGASLVIKYRTRE